MARGIKSGYGQMVAKVVATLTAAGAATSAQAVEPRAPALGGKIASQHVGIAIAIPHVLAMRLADHPATVDITAEDIARGEIVVRGPRAQIIANVRDGYRLRAKLAPSPFAEVQIDGFDRPVRAQPGFTTIETMPNRAYASSQSRALEYRLKISADAQPGRYRWPIALSVQDP